VGIFPNEASIIRLVGAVLMEANDERQLRHRYLSLGALAESPSRMTATGTPLPTPLRHPYLHRAGPDMITPPPPEFKPH
jgi:hypothetical protein